MTRLAQTLQLEHGSRAIRLDRKRLTLIADTNEGPIPLAQIGSGENWIGYHVVAHLALHKLFIERQRPVPAFLILDQPSQSQFPADPQEPGSPQPHDDDRAAVVRLFKELHTAAADLSPQFQIIVVDHVDFKEPWFQRLFGHGGVTAKSSFQKVGSTLRTPMASPNILGASLRHGFRFRPQPSGTSRLLRIHVLAAKP